MAEKKLIKLSSSFCAFLRGVNVKGTNMKMAEVCALFQKSGMENVQAVLATGNIIFLSNKKKNELKPILEKAMSDYFKYEAFLFIKTKEEIAAVISHNPFIAHPGFHIYGFAGIENIENILMHEFQKSGKAENEEAKIVEGFFYWKVNKGDTLHSEFGKILGNKKLKNSFTSRNMNTFEKVYRKM